MSLRDPFGVQEGVFHEGDLSLGLGNEFHVQSTGQLAGGGSPSCLLARDKRCARLTLGSPEVSGGSVGPASRLWALTVPGACLLPNSCHTQGSVSAFPSLHHCLLQNSNALIAANFSLY